jgi:predicted Zn-dependent protease
LPLSRRHFCGLLASTGAASFCGGCAVNPATGKQDLILVGAADEKAIGLREHPKILAQFGGVYNDPSVAGYVASIGGRLAAATETPGLGFTFTLLNSPVVNAFALPGGYVYITRGLMALAQNEAELAGVLGHEIGHVAARHSAQRRSQSMLAQLGVGLLGAVAGGPSSQLAGSVAGLYLKSYSRDQEFEADMLGSRYMTRAGYDSRAMATFLRGLRASSRLDAKIDGRSPGEIDAFNITATHPRTLERVQRAVARAQNQQSRQTRKTQSGRMGRDDYLNSLDGMIFGDGPEQGYVRGQKFAHPTLRFEFTVPPGFTLRNSLKKLTATSRNSGATIVFDAAPKPFPGALTAYLANQWARGARVQQLERITVNGMPGATAQLRGNGPKGPLTMRLIVIRFNARSIYRFLFAAPPSVMPSLSTAFQRTTYSFRRLSPVQAKRLKPRIISIVDGEAGASPERLISRMAFDEFRRERFNVLNGLEGATQRTFDGQVKLVVHAR